MKKQNFIRLIFISLVLAIASSCVLGGTMAKFITVDYGYSAAYVAEWGVTVYADVSTAGGDAEPVYYTSDDGSVSAVSDTYTIQPGSSGYYTFGWYGSAEVDVMCFALPEVNSFFNSGVADDEYYIGGYNGTWLGTDGSAYEPIVWGLYKIEEGTSVDDLSTEENLIGRLYHEDITNNVDENDDNLFLLESTTWEALYTTICNIMYKYEAGTEFSDHYMVTWKWPFYTGLQSDALNDSRIAEYYKYVNYNVSDSSGYYAVIGADYENYSAGDIVLFDDIKTIKDISYTVIYQPYLSTAITGYVIQQENIEESYIED